MKVIDLLNKIANGEEVPNAIKFNDIIYKKADIGKDYYNFTINKWFFKDVFDASGVNLEVEIIEEEKKMPEKLYGIVNPKEGTERIPNNEQLMFKINEIIDVLEILNDKIK